MLLSPSFSPFRRAFRLAEEGASALFSYAIASIFMSSEIVRTQKRDSERGLVRAPLPQASPAFVLTTVLSDCLSETTKGMTKEILFTKQVVGASRIGIGCFISACRKTGFDSRKMQVTTCQRKTPLLHQSSLRTLSGNESAREFPCPGPPGWHLRMPRQVLHDRIIPDISRCPARARGGERTDRWRNIA